ncbi:F-box protein At1g70590 isoform X2 [Magnolia sinica]|uniref:F-box protein At1g70590 isoform X2 n=1 Tax=Magnolia sinica TaxID=86752 RepID=UPI00265A8245|nr:F-box protein At1g70590 isoform X2 [Magnolia sinica]
MRRRGKEGREQRKWAIPWDGIRFSALPFAKEEEEEEEEEEKEPQKRRCGSVSRPHDPTSPLPPTNPKSPPPPPSLSASAPSVAALDPDFSALPFDVLAHIAASFTVPNLWAASMVCRLWREALRPLREAMVLVRWGKRFKHGHGGVRPNLQKALDSFLKGAARGSTPAMVDAGLLYWEMGNKEEGIAWYRKAAALGDPTGQCNLGISFLQAEPPRQEEAVKWFYQAAIAGHVRAQYNLALSLHQGRGIERNLPEAAKWYLRAAEGGNARAMYNTSLCYSSGEGLMRSHRQAKKWMKRAADCGHRKAQYEHGLKLFSMGEMTTALVYLELATRGGETAAAHVRNVLLQQLSPPSRDRAMQSADNWRASR